MSNSETRDSALIILSGLALGALTGAVVGLLFAPASGRATRSEIEDASERMRLRTEAALTDLRKSVEDLVDSTRQYMEDTKARVEASIEAGKQAAAETKEQLSTVVEKQTGQPL